MRKKQKNTQLVSSTKPQRTHDPVLLAQQIIKTLTTPKQKALHEFRIPHDPEYQDVKMLANPLKWWRYRTIVQDVKNRLLINMELSNGEHDHFFVNADNEHFILTNSKKTQTAYVIDHKLKYYDVTAKAYCLDYHENFALPFKRRLPIDKFRTMLEAETSDIAYATNPVNLRRFMQSDIITKILRGDDIEEVIRKLKLYLFIIMGGVAVIILYLLYRFGLSQGG
jgi:hypothetical protein